MAVSVQGMNDVMKKLERLAKFSEKDHNKLVAINKRVAQVFEASLQANIQDFPRDILVQRRRGSDILVKRGQLRRSVGSWQPDKRRITVLAGPRTNTIGRRKTPKNADGWFAHIVEGGDSFGRKKTTVNTGVFMKSKRATQSRMDAMLRRLLQREYKRYMR
jgi:bifunctional N-acetylglucosamine-1-phosphate-uridyltransferase/glucosamine-1-phosphate-acetyltransferase GlmU-like protein